MKIPGLCYFAFNWLSSFLWCHLVSLSSIHISLLFRSFWPSAFLTWTGVPGADATANVCGGDFDVHSQVLLFDFLASSCPDKRFEKQNGTANWPQLASAPLEYYFLSPGQLLELQNGVYSICPHLSPSPSPRVQPKENKYPTACGCVASSARHGQIPVWMFMPCWFLSL